MATTQQTKPNNGGKNAVVLKPLDLGKGGFRTRRTSEQVTAAKIQRQTDLAQKAQKRANTLAATMQRAAERAQNAAKKAQAIVEEAARKEQEEADRRAADEAQRAAIASGAPVEPGPARSTTTVMAVEKTPQVEKVLRELSKDFDKFFKHIFDTYGVRVEAEGPELVKRGYISLKLRGYLQPQRKAVETTASDTGVAREAVRFMQFYKTVGLTPAWLNKEVRIKDDSHTYVLTGLRGKAHAVVLRRKDDPAQAFTIAATDFKKVLQQ